MTRSIVLAAAATFGLAVVSVPIAMVRPSPMAVGGDTLEVTVVVENLAPDNGTFLTPVWVGFHDGEFDTYDRGAPVSMELERLAEDGNTGAISDAFLASGAGFVQGTLLSDVGQPPIPPGGTATMIFELDPDLETSRYFSYASMVIPSNDAFISHGDPVAHEIFSSNGSFRGAEFVVLGLEVVDAGSELNDEDPVNTAFFGQMTPDTGQDESVGIHDHVGFKFPGSGGILDDPMFADGHFIVPSYVVARITVMAEGGGDDDDDDDDDESDEDSDDDSSDDSDDDSDD